MVVTRRCLGGVCGVDARVSGSGWGTRGGGYWEGPWWGGKMPGSLVSGGGKSMGGRQFWHLDT